MPDPLMHILFIDDDEDDFVLVRELLREIEGQRFEVDWVKDYDRGLAALLEDRHDACLVDFQLGLKDGIELIREARAGGCRLPVILLTGRGDHQIDVAAMEAGAADFLQKAHLTPDMLERSLRYAIHSHKVEAQRAQLLAVAEQQAAQLRHLAAELTQAEQRERRRVAQTLHDHLQQLLVAAKMRVDRLQAMASDEKLRKAVKQVAELITDSIEASRSLTVQLSPPVLHDRGLVPALEWLSRQFQHEHDLRVEVEADEPIEPLDDHIKDFLFQAVRELLFNVVKHAGTNTARVSVGRTDETVRVTVADSGKGCEPTEVLGRPANAGFGLFHLQQRAEFLGGSFDIDARPGNGCRMTLTIPLAGVVPPMRNAPARQHEPAPSAPPPRAAPPTRPDAVRVLLADDHKILREGLAGLLRDQPGLEVVGEASSGQFAVELCDDVHPDVVIMDVTMPGMSGIDATRIIRERHPDVHVIGLSMHEKADMAAAMRDAGAAAYLPKGGPSEDLIQAIHHLAARRREQTV